MESHDLSPVKSLAARADSVNPAKLRGQPERSPIRPVHRFPRRRVDGAWACGNTLAAYRARLERRPRPRLAEKTD